MPSIFCTAENFAGVEEGVATGGGGGGVGVVGGAVVVGMVTIGELEDVLPPPPQAVRVAHTESATKRLSVIKFPPRTESSTPPEASDFMFLKVLNSFRHHGQTYVSE